jgi:endoplasmic reticulum-Golgi intermediate compartment protein 3
VNSTRTTDLHVSFDISFPNVACKLLSLDVVDDLGGVVKDAKHEIYKHRLNTLGFKHGEAMKEQLGNTLTSEEHILGEGGGEGEAPAKPAANKCGNCYGAGRAGECCNTCDDVKKAYKRLGWTVKMHEVEQCQALASAETLKEQYSEDGGCQVYGTVELNKASGHFHIVPHNNIRNLKTGRQGGVVNLMDLLSFTFDQFNISHTVNSLSFGHHFPGIASPLDGEERHVKDTHGMYQYYVKIVPTTYEKIDGSEIESNQYSVTEHLRHLSPGSGRGMPGVYFYYQVSPISAQFVETRKPFMRFLTSTCAIIGGTFTVMGIIDVLLSNFLGLFSSNVL